MSNQFTMKNQSVEKMLKVIEYMASMRAPVRLLDISKGTGFPSSTVLRLLTSLIDNGYAMRNDETSKYSLTMKFCRIGDNVRSGLNASQIVHPYLIDISNQTGQTAYYATAKDDMIVYLDAVGGTNLNQRELKHIGYIAPLHATGIGKLILLDYSDRRLMDLETEGKLKRFTGNTLVTYEELKSELAKIQVVGYALDDEECEKGVRCFAVPVRDYTGTIIAGISISGSPEEITESKYREYFKIMKSAAAEISYNFGYSVKD